MQTRIQWADHCGDLPDHLQSVNNWVHFMGQNFEELDEKFILLASEVLEKRIEVYNVVGNQPKPNIYNERVVDNPIYLLYFEEYRFNSQGHFQSIVPLTDLNLYQVLI